MPRSNRPASPQPMKIFESPPGSGGNDGAMPTVYIDGWQFLTNLTLGQIRWFEAQPEFQNFLQYVALSPSTAQAGTPVAVVNSALLAAGKTPKRAT